MENMSDLQMGLKGTLTVSFTSYKSVIYILN